MLLFSLRTATIRSALVRAMMIMTSTMESCMTEDKIWEAYIMSTVIWSSPTAVPDFVSRAAMRKMSRKDSQMQNCMTGALIAMIRSARVKSLRTSSAAFSNFFFSKSSRTKDLTTRMPLISSRTERFMLSYLWNTLSNTGCVLKMTTTSTAARTGTRARNTQEMVTLTENDIASEKMSMSGQRIATRMIIIYAI